MRIVHVVPTYLPATRYGGPIYAVHGLCSALVERGHDVEVITTNADGDSVSDVPLDRPVTMDGVSVRYFPTDSPWLPNALARRMYIAPAMRAHLASRFRSADVAHLHSVFLWPTYAAAREAVRAGVPYVVAPRGMLVPELIRRKSRLIKTAWLEAVEKKTLRQASATHFTSQREWDDASHLGLALPFPFIVPNGIDIPALSDSARMADTFLFLGRINWKKGLEQLIDALALVPHARLIVAGNDEEGLLPSLRARARTLGITERIDFHGPVQRPEKEAQLSTVAALVLPSLSENFANVVLEAMSFATPVIVSPAVGLAREVSQSGAGLVVSNEPTLLAAALASIVANPDRAREMGGRGRAAVESRFRWDHVAAALEAEYQIVMARSPRTAARS